MMLQGSILSSDDLMIKTAPLCAFMKFDGNKRLGIFFFGLQLESVLDYCFRKLAFRFSVVIVGGLVRCFWLS